MDTRSADTASRYCEAANACSKTPPALYVDVAKHPLPIRSVPPFEFPMFLECPVHRPGHAGAELSVASLRPNCPSTNHATCCRCPLFTKVSTFTAVSQGCPVACQPHRCKSLLTITYAPAVCDSPALSVRACRSTVRPPLGGCAASSRGTLQTALVPCVTCSLHATGSIESLTGPLQWRRLTAVATGTYTRARSYQSCQTSS